jgi:hypothetical protein
MGLLTSILVIVGIGWLLRKLDFSFSEFLTEEVRRKIRIYSGYVFIAAGLSLIVLAYMVPTSGTFAAYMGAGLLLIGAFVARVRLKRDNLPSWPKRGEGAEHAEVADPETLGMLLTSGLDEEYREVYEHLIFRGEANLPRNRFRPEDVANAMRTQIFREHSVLVDVETAQRRRLRLRWYCVPWMGMQSMLRIPNFDPEVFSETTE